MLVVVGAGCASRVPSGPESRGPAPPLEVGALQLRAAATLAATLDFEFDPVAPIGPGFYALVRTATIPEQGPAVVYLGPDPVGGRWTFGSDPPEDVLHAARLLRVVGDVRLDTTRGVLSGEARLVVDTGRSRLLPLLLDAKPGDVHVETASGKRCPVAVVPGRAMVVVELPEPTEQVELVVRWKTRTPQIDHCHIRRDSLLLPGKYPWLPTMPDTDAEFDVTLWHPRRFEVLAGGKSGEVAAPRGSPWRAVRTHFEGRDPVTLVGRREWIRRPIRLDGVPVLLALMPSDAGRLDLLETNVRRAHDAFRPLGKLPTRLKIAWCPQPSFQGIASRGFIGFDDFDPHVVAHELAHQYFNGIEDAPPPLRAWERMPASRAWTGDWTEAVAEYLATWAKSESEARAHRLSWSFRYAHVAGDPRPLRELRDKGLPPDDPAHVVVYTKGPLLLAEVERRIGRERMAEVFAQFIEEYDGKRADWSDLADAFGGDERAWLRSWLTLPGAPELKLTDLVLNDGHVEGTLTVSPPVFDGVLEVGMVTSKETLTLRMDQAPATIHTVAFTGGETPFRLKLPEGATGLLIDPEHRLPRRWSGIEGLFVPLPDP